MVINEKKKKSSVWSFILLKAIPFLLVVILAIASFIIFKVFNEKSIESRNKDYLKDNAKGLQQRIDEKFSSSLATISSTSYLISNLNESSIGLENILRNVELETQFDYVGFMDKDGIDHTSNGVVLDDLGNPLSVEERDYFKDGIKGNTGICAIESSVINKKKMVGFYSPVVYKDDIIGVLVGFYTESTIQKEIATYFYGYKSNTIIVDRSGKVIAASLSSYVDDLMDSSEDPNDINSFINTSLFNEDSAKQLNNAIKTKQEISITFNGESGKANMQTIALSSIDWVLIETFPSGANALLNNVANKSGMALQISLVCTATAYIIYLLIRQLILTRRVSEENRLANYVAKASRDLIRTLFYVDLQTETYQDMSSNNLPIPKTGPLVKVKEYVISEIQDQKQIQDVMHFFNPQYLKAVTDEQKPDMIIKVINDYSKRDLYLSMSFVILETLDEEVTKGLIAFTDVTNEIEKELDSTKELEKAYNDAQIANRAKSTFLFNMSHDIRTPMNAIIGYSDLLLEHLDDPERSRDYLEKLKRSSTFLLSLINNVLDMARIESGQTTLSESVWDSTKFYKDLTSVFEGTSRQKDIKFINNIDIQHFNILCDATKLRQIYLNILSNAFKYTPSGGTVTLSLKELPSDREGYALFQTTISDTGIGMSKEFLPKIFEEFSREKTSTESKVTGTGLGMPIVKALVTLMDGTITVESEQGKGTTFVVTIPHKIASKEELETKEKKEEEIILPSFRGKRILLTEDNDLNAEIAQTILEEAGFKVERAADGSICVDMLKKAPIGYYDIVLMDIQMPVMDGYTATEKIREINDDRCNIPIIAMTANAFDEDRKKAIVCGMNDHTAKPINIPVLLEAINRVLKK